MNYINGEITLNIGFMSSWKPSDLKYLLHQTGGKLSLMIAGEELIIDANQVLGSNLKGFDDETGEELDEEEIVECYELLK